MSTPTCENCRFAREVDRGGQANPQHQCRRFPPTGSGMDRHWVAVWAQDWCGEHEPKAESEPVSGKAISPVGDERTGSHT